MTTLAPPRCARRETPSLGLSAAFLRAAMALACRTEGRIIGLLDRIEERREAAAARRLLASFDDRMLADIGLTRTDLDRL